MNKINIEINENERKADYQILINEKLEHEVKGLRFNDNNEIMDWVNRSYNQCISIKKPEKKVDKGSAKFAGYYAIAQAIAFRRINASFTTKDLATNIDNPANKSFTQTSANISAALSAFKKSNWYPDWLKVIGMRGRSREYMKTKDVSTREIEDDLRKAAKKAWS